MSRNRTCRTPRFTASSRNWQEIHFSLQRGYALELDVESGAHLSQFESQSRNMGVQHRKFPEDGRRFKRSHSVSPSHINGRGADRLFCLAHPSEGEEEAASSFQLLSS